MEHSRFTIVVADIGLHLIERLLPIVAVGDDLAADNRGIVVTRGAVLQRLGNFAAIDRLFRLHVDRQLIV